MVGAGRDFRARSELFFGDLGEWRGENFFYLAGKKIQKRFDFRELENNLVLSAERADEIFEGGAGRRA
jgi:hypothetical protein